MHGSHGKSIAQKSSASWICPQRHPQSPLANLYSHQSIRSLDAVSAEHGEVRNDPAVKNARRHLEMDREGIRWTWLLRAAFCIGLAVGFAFQLLLIFFIVWIKFMENHIRRSFILAELSLKLSTKLYSLTIKFFYSFNVLLSMFLYFSSISECISLCCFWIMDGLPWSFGWSFWETVWTAPSTIWKFLLLEVPSFCRAAPSLQLSSRHSAPFFLANHWVSSQLPLVPWY